MLTGNADHPLASTSLPCGPVNPWRAQIQQSPLRLPLHGAGQARCTIAASATAVAAPSLLSVISVAPKRALGQTTGAPEPAAAPIATRAADSAGPAGGADQATGTCQLEQVLVPDHNDLDLGTGAAASAVAAWRPWPPAAAIAALPAARPTIAAIRAIATGAPGTTCPTVSAARAGELEGNRIGRQDRKLAKQVAAGLEPQVESAHTAAPGDGHRDEATRATLTSVFSRRTLVAIPAVPTRATGIAPGSPPPPIQRRRGTRK